MISVDGYPFLAFSDLTCHFKNTQIGVFWFTVTPDSKETKFGSGYQEVSPSAGKNTRVVSVLCHAWKCVPTSTSSGVDISKVPECNLL